MDDINDIEMDNPIIIIFGNNYYKIFKKVIELNEFIKTVRHDYIFNNPERYEIYNINNEYDNKKINQYDYIFEGETILIIDRKIKYWKIFIIYPGKYHIKSPNTYLTNEPLIEVETALKYGALYVETRWSYSPHITNTKLGNYWWPGKRL